MDKNLDIHRSSEVTRILRLLDNLSDGLNICGINGPGGVGKTFLVEHVLNSFDLRKNGFLYLSVNGSDAQKRHDFLRLIDGQLAPRSLPPPAKPKTDYFPQIREIASIHRELINKVSEELDKKDMAEDVKSLALALLKTGHILNKIIPKTKEYLNVNALKDQDVTSIAEDVYKQIQTLEALKNSTFLPGPLRDLVGITRKNNVRQDLYGTVADALITDLSAAISGYRAKDRFKLLHRKIEGITKLLIVIDDFEALATTLGDFLVANFVPQLAEANFTTLMIIIGRDDLEATHVGWDQHCRKYIRDEIRVEPLKKEEALGLLLAAGVPEQRRLALFEATQGLPFLLKLAIEEINSADGETALFLSKFYERITKWMSDREKGWFAKLCYLDEVNEDTLRWIFPEEDVSTIQKWFERDSVRDPSSRIFRVRPLIRDKVLRYHEVRTPSLHKKMVELVREEQGKLNAKQPLVATPLKG